MASSNKDAHNHHFWQVSKSFSDEDPGQSLCQESCTDPSRWSKALLSFSCHSPEEQFYNNMAGESKDEASICNSSFSS